MITEHCMCPIPCLCGCQVMAQNVFVQLNAHEDAIFTMLKQGKVHNTIQYARLYNCITSENIQDVLQLSVCQDLVNGLMEADFSRNETYLPISIGQILMSLATLNKSELTVHLLQAMLLPAVGNNDRNSKILSLQRAVTIDKETTQGQWSTIMQFLNVNGQEEIVVQLLAVITVRDIITKAVSTVQDDRKTVLFSLAIETYSDSDKDDDFNREMSAGSRDSISFDHLTEFRESYTRDQSLGQMSSNVSVQRNSPRLSILRKRFENESGTSPSLYETSSQNSLSPTPKKKVGHVSNVRSSSVQTRLKDYESDGDVSSPENKRSVSKEWGGIRFMDNDPYTSNPESPEEDYTD